MRRWGVNVVLAGVTLVFIVALCLEMHVMHSIHAKVHEDAVLSPKSDLLPDALPGEASPEARAFASARGALVTSDQPRRLLAWEKGVLAEPLPYPDPLPPVVDAFRKGHVDWHELIPSHSSLWERYGESADAKFNFMKLVMKEVAVTDYLTLYSESGLSRIYGNDAGPLTNYSGCNLLNDACGIHSERTCARDSFCEWSASKRSCATNAGGPATQSCAEPKKYGKEGWGEVATDSCARYVHEPAFVVRVGSEPAEMFFHWWRFFKEVYNALVPRGTAVAKDKAVHFLVEHKSNTQFFHYFGLLSNSCWRRLESDVPEDTCFCHVLERRGSGGGLSASDKDMLNFLIKALDLERMPEPSKIRVGIISRRRKRFILNEDELVRAVLAMGLDVQILPLEEMTLYEQLAALRSVTILVGIHGSGLNNAIFLPTGACLVQLLPFKLKYKGAFERNALSAGVAYREWSLTDASKSVFHWEFLGPRELSKGREAVLERGSPSSGAEVYTFWINQDIIVPVDEFTALIQNAIDTTPLNVRLAAESGHAHAENR